ncbi:MAG TPA: hypothetical protein VEL47_03790 [Myxococcota bacterium]|nr:hypothetical protein [Myxococcota bacterium]
MKNLCVLSVVTTVALFGANNLSAQRCNSAAEKELANLLTLNKVDTKTTYELVEMADVRQRDLGSGAQFGLSLRRETKEGSVFVFVLYGTQGLEDKVDYESFATFNKVTVNTDPNSFIWVNGHCYVQPLRVIED